MAELPNLGLHCGVELCHQLDFLPIRCDSCNGTYCRHHFTYESHECVGAHSKNVQVPVCPLCSKPVPTPRGVLPDVNVNEHIQNNCQSAPKKKIYTKFCSVDNCKKRELIPMNCSSCRQQFCIRHRHIKDHNCTAAQRPLSNAGAAALARNQGAQNCSKEAKNTNEDLSTEELDRRLAESLQMDEYQRNPAGRNTRNSNSSNCTIA